MPRTTPRFVPALALALTVASCGGDSPSAPAPTPQSLTPSGSGQSGPVGQPLANPLAVVVTGSNGQPFAGANVTWQVASGGGSLSASSSQTDAQGRTSVTWTLGGTVGAQTATATVSGVAPATFTATAVPGTVAQLVLGPATPTIDALQGTVQLTAQAQDQFDNPVPGAAVAWSSGSSNIATVDAQTGVVTGVAVGTAAITATAGAVSRSIDVVVRQVAATVVVSPSQPQLAIGSTVQLAGTVADANGHPMPATALTWTSANDAVATVNASGVVTAVGSGTAAIQAASGTVNGSTNVAVLADFAPQTSTQVSGTMTVGRLNIPAGVTVTATSSLSVTVLGPVQIAGALSGNCVPITVRGRQLVTVTGRIDNGCATGAAEEPLVIVAEGGYVLNGAEITTGGALTIVNDSTLLAAGALATAAGGPRAATGQSGGPCDLQNTIIKPLPQRLRDGADGQFGGNGASAREWALLCTGDLRIMGDVKIHGQSGGNGGNGTHLSNVLALATGGDGGWGGIIRVRASGWVRFSGSGNYLETGLGGDGGSAEATAAINEAGARAPSAGALGGDGGQPGRLDLGGDVGLEVLAPFEILLGLAGNGGDAFATAADGQEERGIQPAQAGGDADARAGDGSDTPQEVLRHEPQTIGAEFIIVRGGAGGNGGFAEAKAGNGGNGAALFKHGAMGGDAEAIGGDGGSSFVKDWQNTITGLAGNGGDAVLRGGSGGNGWNDCVPGALQPGGNGGSGGLIAGQNGLAGSGSTPGATGIIFVIDAGHGGNGGNGDGPGAGGAAGLSDLRPSEPLAGPNIVNSFTPGAPGNPCTPAAGRISGRTVITQPNFFPVPGVTVAAGDLTATTDANGEYSIENVPAGQVTVRAVGGVPPGRECDEATVSLAPGEHKVVDLDCTRQIALVVTPTEIVQTHTVGTTPCPQFLASMVLTNPTGETLEYAILGPPEAVARLLISGGGTGTIPAGGTRTLGVGFNCSTTTSFETYIDVVTRKNGVEIMRTRIPVILTIS